MHRTILTIAFLLVGFLLACTVSVPRAAAEQGAAPRRPDIVVILCDDLGYGDLACYGHPHIKTRQLDQLAANGLRLTACYSAAPVCSPSRVGLLTGRSPNRAGVYDWIPEARGPRPDARDQVHMRRGEVAIAQLLKQAGYATCMAGKWHCNSRFNSAEQPQPGDFGFDHWLATQNNAAPSHENPRNFVRNGQAVGGLQGYSCQLVVDEALSWLDDQTTRQPEQPFLLFLPFHEPHEPVASPKELVAEYLPVARNADEAQYFANVANVDRAVGRLVAALGRLGRLENTLLIFTSDNGPETLKRYRGANRSYGRPGPLRGMKLWTTEAGFRVPGIIHWPAVLTSGQVSDQPVSSLDFLPTFCRLAGTVPPSALQLDGTDFSPLLHGRTIRRDKPLLWCYYNALNQQRVAMRSGPWKLLARLDGGKLPKYENVHAGNADQVRSATLTDFELYRVREDIGEAHEVSEKYPEEAERLQNQMRSQFEELVRGSHVWQSK